MSTRFFVQHQNLVIGYRPTRQYGANTERIGELTWQTLYPEYIGSQSGDEMRTGKGSTASPLAASPPGAKHVPAPYVLCSFSDRMNRFQICEPSIWVKKQLFFHDKHKYSMVRDHDRGSFFSHWKYGSSQTDRQKPAAPSVPITNENMTAGSSSPHASHQRDRLRSLLDNLSLRPVGLRLRHA